MTPAQCSVCGIHATQETGARRGEWLSFADYQPADAAMLSHPQGLAYFCSEHLASAHALRHLTADEAIVQLREQTRTEAVLCESTSPKPANGVRRLIQWLKA